MQRGSRFSLFRRVKTRHLQTTSSSRSEFLPRRNASQYYLAYVTRRCHKPGAILLNCASAKEFSFSAWNQSTLPHLSILGHDRVRCARGAPNPENADVVDPSGSTMIAAITDCSEITT